MPHRITIIIAWESIVVEIVTVFVHVHPCFYIATLGRGSQHYYIKQWVVKVI